MQFTNQHFSNVFLTKEIYDLPFQGDLKLSSASSFTKQLPPPNISSNTTQDYPLIQDNTDSPNVETYPQYIQHSNKPQ